MQVQITTESGKTVINIEHVDGDILRVSDILKMHIEKAIKDGEKPEKIVLFLCKLFHKDDVVEAFNRAHGAPYARKGIIETTLHGIFLHPDKMDERGDAPTSAEFVQIKSEPDIERKLHR